MILVVKYMNENKIICFNLFYFPYHVVNVDRQSGLYSVSLSRFRVEFLPRSLLVLVQAAGAEIH